MKTKLQLTCLTRRALLAALICSAPLLAPAEEMRDGKTRHGRFAPESQREKTSRLESRSRLASAQTTAFLHQRLERLKVKDPRHFKTHAYLDSLIDTGFDPPLLNHWLDALSDDVVVVGMPDDLVLIYYGEPVSRNDVVFDGEPAEVWGIPLRGGRIEKVTISGDKVVRVRG